MAWANEGPEHILQHSVHTFYLAISLRVIGSGHVEPDTQLIIPLPTSIGLAKIMQVASPRAVGVLGLPTAPRELWVLAIPGRC